MAFPSELPALRRQAIAPPHPLAAAFAWAGLSYAISCALLRVPVSHELAPGGLSFAFGSAGAGAACASIIASLVPALIIAALARQSPPVWPAARVAATYLSMLGFVVALQLMGATTEGALAASSDARECCALVKSR